jgi:hypothetical protein
LDYLRYCRFYTLSHDRGFIYVAQCLNYDLVAHGVSVLEVLNSLERVIKTRIPELSVLRILGLFDRPAQQNALEALVKSPQANFGASLAGPIDRSSVPRRIIDHCEVFCSLKPQGQLFPLSFSPSHPSFRLRFDPCEFILHHRRFAR